MNRCSGQPEQMSGKRIVEGGALALECECVKKLGLSAFLIMVLASSLIAADKPNVLFIAIDDINDWISPMGGHPQVKTPHLDAFTQSGSVVFQNAVCPAPVCGPSRSALLSGFMPYRTGVYNNETNMLDSKYVQEHPTLPEYFSMHGYHTLSTGKIFHKHAAQAGADWGQWAFDTFRRADGSIKPNQERLTHQKLGLVNGKPAQGPPPAHSWGALSWAPTQVPMEETTDYRSADWARQQLKKKWDKPFFMAIGISRPHLPWYVPQEFFDMYDRETLTTAEIKADDLEDIRTSSDRQKFKANADYLWVKENGIEQAATEAYLAAVSYADACLGVIFEALEKSEYADNTIVLIWGDHGYHVGEKLKYKKNSLWRESVRTPLIVRKPGMKKSISSTRPVNLIDMYPTLIQLCGLPEKSLDGHDFSPLLNNPDLEWKQPGITVTEKATSVFTEKWHFIDHGEGTRELYHLENDDAEWTNLIDSPEAKDAVSRLEKFVPAERAEPVESPVVPKKNKKPSTPLDETLKSKRQFN